ncbi:hypothetical protein [Kallotenue papyrolyticum]|uniref:hypothetical protein n=1 Tax=Kallotenue papyrolyticum TaxID=1325125 RepID=UPI000478644E|nr:hypothetical protein [Kallotenue papyrolyticum]
MLVEATAPGEPRLTPPDGQALALQYVRVEHTEGDDEDRRTGVDYEYVAPVELLIGAGRQTVRAQGIDLPFLQRQRAARLNGDGRATGSGDRRTRSDLQRPACRAPWPGDDLEHPGAGWRDGI